MECARFAARRYTVPSAFPRAGTRAPQKEREVCCQAPRCLPPAPGRRPAAVPLSRPQPAARTPSCLLQATQVAAAPPAPSRPGEAAASPFCPPPSPPGSRSRATDRAREDPGRRPARRGRDARRRPGAGWGGWGEPRERGRLQPLPGALPRGPAHPAPHRGQRPAAPDKAGGGPPSPSRSTTPPTHPRRARAPALHLTRPPPSPTAAFPLPTARRERPPQPRAGGCPRAGRGGGARRGVGAREREPGGALLGAAVSCPTAANRPAGAEGCPSPAREKLARRERPLVKLTPPARRLRGPSRTYSPSREQQRRADTARPHRCLAAAATNERAKRGHASQ